ncbi:NUDIX domain-containing protein [bacterium]|nr:NUDIX domain-containing protein [bacterium]
MYRKGVSALIFNKKDQLLLVNLESFNEKYFSVPGGSLEEGETLEQAAYREVAEELGIRKDSLELVGKSSLPLQVTFREIKLIRDGKEYQGSERYFFGFHFTGDDGEIGLKKGEVRAYKWVAFAELKDYLLFDNQLDDTLRKIAEIFPSPMV